MALHLQSYINILEPRRKEVNNVLFIYREINPKKSYKHIITPTPESHKRDVLESINMKKLLKKISKETGTSIEELKNQVRDILEEIGFEKEITVIRWLGFVLLKLLLRAIEGIFVNEASVLKLKPLMGNCPIVLVPSHRSYVDFNVMTYICFHYDMATPVIAAGIDFKGMAIFGKVLRQVGAFYMRRSFSDTDFLYWQIFEQYVHQIVTKGDLPIEFFIEGTRSRTGKSLWPKYGLLTMVLKSFFTSEVPDIIFIPVNVSYDRILEERLFAYELLGVPKPKESTSGFFQSLHHLEQEYGKVYVTFSEPISAASSFNKKFDHSIHNLNPLHHQELTTSERNLIKQFALEIVDNQQSHSVITPFNLIATVILSSYINNELLTIDIVKKNVLVLKLITEMFGGKVAFTSFEESIDEALKIHRNLICLNQGTLQLVKNCEKLIHTCPEKLKGHSFLQSTMNLAVPFILLQEYINPLMYFLVNACLITCIMKCSSSSTFCKEGIFEDFIYFRSLFSYEFVGTKRERADFENCWKKLINLNLVVFNTEDYCLGNNKQLLELLSKLMEPFLITYYVVCSVIYQGKEMPENAIIKSSQEKLENILSTSECFVHPYILSLNSISNCLYSLTYLRAIQRIKMKTEVSYYGSPAKLLDVTMKLGELLQGNPIIWNILDKKQLHSSKF